MCGVDVLGEVLYTCTEAREAHLCSALSSSSLFSWGGYLTEPGAGLAVSKTQWFSCLYSQAVQGLGMYVWSHPRFLCRNLGFELRRWCLQSRSSYLLTHLPKTFIVIIFLRQSDLTSFMRPYALKNPSPQGKVPAGVCIPRDVVRVDLEMRSSVFRLRETKRPILKTKASNYLVLWLWPPWPAYAIL